MAARTRFLSVGFKLAIGTVLVLGAVSTIVYIKLSAGERDNLLFAKRQTATAIAELSAKGATAPLIFADLDSARSDINNIGANEEVVYAAIWQDGKAEPEAEHWRSGGPKSRPIPVPHNGESVEVFDDRIAVTRSVHDPQGQRIGYVVVQFSLRRENGEYQVAKRRVLVTSLALSALVAAALIILTRRMIVLPLARLATAAKDVAAGCHARVSTQANDEVGQLAQVFNEMSDAIVDRENKLSLAHRNTRQLFDNMAQAVLSFAPDRLVSAEYSASAAIIFQNDRLTGHDVLDLFFPGETEASLEREAMRDWITLAFHSPLEDWSEIASLAPPEAILRPDADDEAALLLTFRPIVEEGTIVRILVVATDETDKRRLERKSREQDEQHRRQMAAMRSLVTGNLQSFLQFLKGSALRLEQIRTALDRAGGEWAHVEIETLFSAIHTVKGEARVYERAELEAQAHEIEERFTALRALAKESGHASLERFTAGLRTSLNKAQQCLDEAREELVNSSPVGAAILDQLSVRASDVDRLVALVGDRQDELAMLVDRLAARPFGELTVAFVHAVPSWAHERGKLATISIQGKETAIPNRLATCLGGALTHLVRNAIVHGIEAPADRDAAGKEAIGRICIRCSCGERGPSVEVEDDGAGINTSALVARARALGSSVQPGKELELVFVSGLSTADTGSTLAGRGVGMSAVRSDLAEVGYCVDVRSTPGKGCLVRIYPGSMTVPPAWKSTPPGGPALWT